MEVDSDIYMDAVRFLTFVNLVLSCSVKKKCFFDFNKIHLNPYKLCKDDKVYCSICLSDVLSREYIRELKCNHKFHKKCIDKWIKNCINLETIVQCPMCRDNISI